MKNFFHKHKTPFLYHEDSLADSPPQIQEHLNSIIKLDKDGNLVAFNQAFAAQFGYGVKDFKKPFFEIFLQNDASLAQPYFEKALLGNTQQFHAVSFKKNGIKVDVNLTLVPLEDQTEAIVYAVINDISEYKEWEKKLHLSRKVQSSFNELENICYFFYDAINDQFHFSKQFPELFGINEDSSYTPAHKKMLQYVYAEDQENVNHIFKEALKNKTGYKVEYRIPKKDDTFRYVFEKADILLNANGYLEGLTGFIQDITHSKLYDQMIEKEKQLSLLSDIPDFSIWTMNVTSGFTTNNSKGVEHITGYTAEELQNGIQWTSIIHPQDIQRYRKALRVLGTGETFRLQYRIIHKNGTVKWIQDYIIPVLDGKGKLTQMNGITSDVTIQKGLEEQIKFLSKYDPLTKLPNRQYFYEKIEQLMSEHAGKQKSAIMMLNIDRFKYVNDTLGYEIGDQLLVKIAERLAEQLTPQDLLARQDGAQFSILVGSVSSMDALRTLAETIIHCLEEPFLIKDFQLYVTVCIGISACPGKGTECLELFRNAEHALTKAKKGGENKYYIITDSNNIQSYKCFSIGRDIKKALRNGEMVMYYQPRVDANTNKMLSAEALIRWNHPEWGHISPDEFLGIAEENGLIIDIDNWVIQEVCRQIKQWKDAGLPLVPVSVNIAAAHLTKRDWPIEVAKFIKEAGIEPQDIELEITENSLLNNESMVQQAIEIFQRLGIKIALDDFGKGYSSLLYLTQYHFDILKIDKSFIQSMQDSERDLFIAKSIIYLAKGLNIRVVAEGVETMDQLEILKKENCREIQGYLFSRPVPVSEFEQLLKKEILLPVDPKQKAERKNRQYYRLQFPYPLSSSMRLISIAGKDMHLGKSTVLIDDISIDGLRCISTLKLPVRGDVVFQFETEVLHTPLQFLGRIVWKEEQNNNLVEYGFQFMNNEDEQVKLDSTLNKFLDLQKKSTKLPPYHLVKEDKLQYLLRMNS
ncbi:EAL domain-containing protein [Bacillus benzoevorans]|uniref:Diguanylate cyclase (GGDEF)-like protein/PAS domain S-box-containing protein n=1 Tax=Bacillus benzoevorans TaxID=1456 RepID=A0A7X0LWA7_9BACI|nr:EAL domain-containing protein [Bacillus benzoevorans]MBB6445139.1 diguanylate cyclase (GGDEF)-like protein/PAS domain S-box-containing protein [Bacillus benzoevorans]